MGKRKKVVFLTGITGFLGSFLAKELIQKGYKVIGLARGKGSKSAKQRVMEAVRFAYYDDEWDRRKVIRSLLVVEGDIIRPDLGIKTRERNALESEIDIIIHSAALAELRSPWKVIRKINVDGTRHVLDFAMKCKKRGRLQKFNHISTMYVCGDYQGAFDETMLDVGQKFNNTYERSKFGAEVLVRAHKNKGLFCSIFRPSLVMGDTKTGKTNKFKAFYQLLHYLSREVFTCFPIDINVTQNLINVDDVASVISISIDECNNEPVFHIVNPLQVNVADFIRLAARYFNFKLPTFLPPSEDNFNKLSAVQKYMIRPFIFCSTPTAPFVAHCTRRMTRMHSFSYTEFDKKNIHRIFEFCVKSGFMKKK